jgi:outer membrane protein TolC
MRRALVILIVLATAVCYGQNPVYTLQDCLQEGIENNYSIKIQRNRQIVSDNNATIGNAGFLPSLSAQGRYSGNSQDTDTKLRDTRQIVEENGIFNQTIDAGVDLNWTIFEGFNVVSTYRKLQELKSQGELNTRIALENLIADITAEYYNYIQQKIRLKNLRYAVALSKERLRIVEQRYRIGNFSGLDYQQARVDFNSDSSKFMKQQETLKSSAIVLNELLAREDLDKTITVADTAITVDKFIELNDIMDSMMDNNASLLLAKSQSSVSELEYKITSSQSYPYLRMNAGYGYTKNTYNKGQNLPFIPCRRQLRLF